MHVSPVRLRPFFALLGYAVISSVIVVGLLEFGSFLVLTAYHWIRPDLQESIADTSPAYSGYPWASEFWKEERSRWNSQHGSYEPFRIWGVAPWNGKYINTDNSPDGTWRRGRLCHESRSDPSNGTAQGWSAPWHGHLL